jgi:hypothetical protein
MHRPSSWLVLVAAAGLVLPSAAQGNPGKGKGGKQPDEGAPMSVDSGDVLAPGAWKPGFDYTHLMPPTEALWANVAGAGVEMESAIQLAAEVLGGPVWAMKAALVDHEGNPAWSLQLFATSEGSDVPRRVDLVVSSREPKVLARVDQPSIPEAESQIWNRLAKAAVQAEAAITLCKVNARGEKPEPQITEPHMRTIEFVASEQPYWTCEMMGMEKAIPRRYGIEVRGHKPGLRQKLMLDRFPGTPLRRNHPVELPNGMFLYDFTTGDGPLVAPESKVTVHYRLFLLDGSKLHDTWRTNLPETFVVSQAPLKGMTEGMVGMRVGGKRKIAIPYEMAFGEKGNEIVPPKAMVVCDVFVSEVL